jgi:preprotein translocase subunit SecA
VYRTAEEKWEAVINDIKMANKKNQPVLVGTTSIEKSEMLSNLLKKHKINHNVLNARHHEEEANIIAQAGIPKSVTIATNMAGRGTDIQLGGNTEMLQINSKIPQDKLLNNISMNKDLAIKSGGLYVIGTERHESRRTDNQLRGRSGRQGDPGESKFYLSLEDDLMRIFGSEKLDNMLLKLGLKKGEAIVHKWVNKALEKAQQKVEARNFEIRKNLLRFDDVMNDQRKAIYEQRKDLIQSNNISETINNMRQEVIESLVEANIPPKAYPEKWNTKVLNTSLKELGLNLPVVKWSDEEGIAEEEIKSRILNAAMERAKEKLNILGEDNMRLIEKQIMLQIIDQNWKEHLLQLDHIRQGIGLRAYAQRDPLNEYKSEAFNLFYSMLEKIRMQTTAILLNIQITTEIPSRRERKTDFFEESSKPRLTNRGIKSKKIGRNAPCPCGSGKKYKHCHGKAA